MTPSRLLPLLGLLACGTNGPGGTQAVTPPADVVLAVGERQVVDGLEIIFVRVVEDSRCPANAQCVWAGNAAVELALASGSGAPVNRVLNSTTEPKALEEAGLRIVLKELLPYPGTETGKSSGTRLTLRVEKP